MTEELPDLIQCGILFLTPVEDLTISPEDNPELYEGVVHERVPDVFTSGHHSMLTVERLNPAG